jgi:hypothetical protein
MNFGFRIARFLERLSLALLLLIGLSPAAPAATPDVHVSGASYYVTLAQNVAWNQLSANYIFTPQSPNVGVCLFIENKNPTSTHSLTVAAFQNGNPSLTGYAASPALWASDLIQYPPASIPAGTVAAAYINTTGAANVAIVVSGTSTSSGTPDTANIFVVQSTSQNCGPVGPTLVEGAVPETSSITKINPVLIAGKTPGNLIATPSIGGGANGWDLSTGATITTEGGAKQQNTGPSGGGSSSTIPMYSPQFWNNSTVSSGFERMLTTNSFGAAAATASGSTLVWTPNASTRFVLQCVSVDVTGDAKQASAGDLTITLTDSGTTIPGFLWEVYVGTTSLDTSGELYSSGTVCFKNGFRSSTVANVLDVNLSAALTSGAVVVRAWGTNTIQ